MRRAAGLILAIVCGCAQASAQGEKAGSGTQPSTAAAPSPSSPASASSTLTAPASSALPLPSPSALPAAGFATTAAPSPVATAAPGTVLWATRLGPLLFRDINTLANVTLRLYRDDGSFDEDAAAEVDRVIWAAKDDDPPHVNRRLLRLVVKAAAHFDAHEIHVISSHRGKARKGSRHRTGEAIDFLFPDVPPKLIAAELRTFARVGVGEYIHPRSQFVHLDVRDQSYHWIDGSPPGRSWKEHALPDLTAAARDAAYTPEQDLPGLAPPR